MTWYVIERLCASCGADMVLRGPFATKEEAESSPSEWPGMICTDVRVMQPGVVDSKRYERDR
jgi:hypothetical protein